MFGNDVGFERPSAHQLSQQGHYRADALTSQGVGQDAPPSAEQLFVEQPKRSAEEPLPAFRTPVKMKMEDESGDVGKLMIQDTETPLSSREMSTPKSDTPEAETPRVRKSRQVDKAVRLYNYMARLQAMRLHVQKIIEPSDYEEYVGLIRKYAEQELDIMLTLDYKDLCFAEETIEKKVKQLEEFSSLTGAMLFAWRRIGDLLVASPAMCQHLNMTQEELLKLNFVEMLPPDQLYSMIKFVFLRLHFYGNPEGIVRDVAIRHPKTDVLLRFRASFTHVRDVFMLPAMTFGIFVPYD